MHWLNTMDNIEDKVIEFIDRFLANIDVYVRVWGFTYDDLANSLEETSAERFFEIIDNPSDASLTELSDIASSLGVTSYDLLCQDVEWNTWLAKTIEWSFSEK